jgi:hypothetical protein
VPSWLQAVIEQGAVPAERGVGFAASFAGLRAYPVSPADERNALREQYAQSDYGIPYAQTSKTQKMEMEQVHADLAGKVTEANKLATSRGNVYSLYWDDVNKARAPIQAEVDTINAEFAAGNSGMTGNEYRKAIQEREMQMALVPETLQNSSAYAGKLDIAQAKVAANPVDAFLDAWYDITRKLTNQSTGEADPAAIVRAREYLKAATDPGVVTEALAYLNRNRTPEYAQAMQEYAAYQNIPQYLGLSKAQQDMANQAARTIRSARQANPYISAQTTQAMYAAKYPQQYAMYKLSRNLGNPARKRFWAAHSLLSKYYSDLTADDVSLVPQA